MVIKCSYDLMKYMYDTNIAVDGYMSEWGSWGGCSVTCGGGFKMRTRTCHDPIYGGKPCQGDTVQINPSCNYQPCPGNE